MLYKHTKAMARSTDKDTDFFHIVAEVLQRVMLTTYMFIIYLDNVHRMSVDLIKENSFTLKKKVRSKRYPAETNRRWRSRQPRTSRKYNCRIATV